METLFLLIVLTQNGAGDINASFVNTGSFQQCQQKALMLAGVFTGAKVPVIESHCVKSDLQFSEFEHASTTSKVRYFYTISFDNESVQVSKMSDWHRCQQQSNIKPDVNFHVDSRQGSVYCSSSVQSFK